VDEHCGKMFGYHNNTYACVDNSYDIKMDFEVGAKQASMTNPGILILTSCLFDFSQIAEERQGQIILC